MLDSWTPSNHALAKHVFYDFIQVIEHFKSGMELYQKSLSMSLRSKVEIPARKSLPLLPPVPHRTRGLPTFRLTSSFPQRPPPWTSTPYTRIVKHPSAPCWTWVALTSIGRKGALELEISYSNSSPAIPELNRPPYPLRLLPHLQNTNILVLEDHCAG